MFCSLWPSRCLRRLQDKRSCVFTRNWSLIVVDCEQWKNERLLVVYVCRVCCESKNSKNVSFRLIMISLEKSVSTWQFPVNKVIKFGPCWEAPYLWLVTYWQWHYRISWENGGRITKTPALIAGAPFPFPSFVLFSLPLSLPFLRLPRRLAKTAGHLIFPLPLAAWCFSPGETSQAVGNDKKRLFLQANDFTTL